MSLTGAEALSQGAAKRRHSQDEQCRNAKCDRDGKALQVFGLKSEQHETERRHG